MAPEFSPVHNTRDVMTSENSNNVYERECYGKDLNFAIGDLRARIVRQAEAGRRYRIVVELLAEVTVEDCLLAAQKSGTLVKDGDERYHWAQGVSLGERALWVELVSELTGLKKKWKWAEQLWGDKNLKQEVSKARKNSTAIVFVKGILPCMLNV